MLRNTQLSLQNLLVDDQGSSTGIYAAFTASLETIDVTLQQFQADPLTNNAGEAVSLQEASTFKRTNFLDTSATAAVGAVYMVFAAATFTEVGMFSSVWC